MYTFFSHTNDILMYTQICYSSSFMQLFGQLINQHRAIYELQRNINSIDKHYT